MKSHTAVPIIGEELFDRFKIGDLVMWFHDLHTEKTGIILEISTEQYGNRKFPSAKVYPMGSEKHQTLLLASLRNITQTSD